jgi:hypothetical protein
VVGLAMHGAGPAARGATAAVAGGADAADVAGHAGGRVAGGAAGDVAGTGAGRAAGGAAGADAGGHAGTTTVRTAGDAGASGAGKAGAKPPAHPPPATPVGRGGGQPMSIKETRELFEKSVKRGTALSEENVELSVDAATHQQAWRNAGGTGAAPAAFVDPTSHRIWVRVNDQDTLTLFHEAIHQRSMAAGARNPFLDRYGTFMEEGITERLTRMHLGPDALSHPYDINVHFLEQMERRMGVTQQALSRAYLDGDRAPLEAAIRAALNNDHMLAASFVQRLRSIGADVADRTALSDALYMMVMKRPPIP